MSLKCILDSISLSLYNAFLALSWNSRESCILDVYFFVRLNLVAHSLSFFFNLCCIKIKEMGPQKSVASGLQTMSLRSQKVSAYCFDWAKIPWPTPFVFVRALRKVWPLISKPCRCAPKRFLLDWAKIYLIFHHHYFPVKMIYGACDGSLLVRFSHFHQFPSAPSAPAVLPLQPASCTDQPYSP